MDLRRNPRAAAAARQIEARTGFDVLDDTQVDRAMALCSRQRARAVRMAVISGGLAAAIAVALVIAGVIGRVDAYAAVLGAVLLVINLVRAARAVWSARRLRRIPRSIELMQAQVRAAGRSASSRDTAPWN